VAETFALAEGLDLDPNLMLDAIEGDALAARGRGLQPYLPHSTPRRDSA
jgi:hypothetical protein